MRRRTGYELSDVGFTNYSRRSAMRSVFFCSAAKLVTLEPLGDRAHGRGKAPTFWLGHMQASLLATLAFRVVYRSA